MKLNVLLDNIPRAVEHFKSEEPDRYSVIGEAVNDSGFLQAVLSHGTFDGYFYIRRSDTPPDILDHYRGSDRLRPVTVPSLQILDDCGPLVLFTSSILFQKYASFRLARKHPDWPICGVTHTLSTIYPRVSFGSPRLFPYDALICTTPGARLTLERLMYEHSCSSSVVRPTPILPAIRYPVIPLAVDVTTAGDSRLKGAARNELNIHKDEVVFLFLGRLSHRNKTDFHPLIQAFLETPGIGEFCRLIIAGDDTRHHLADGLRDFAQQFDSERNVSVMPNITQKQKRELLSASDVFLAISDTVEETFGITVIEAMMSGLPIIASDWNGYRYLVRHGTDGWLVPTYMYTDGMELSAISPLLDCAYHQTQRVSVDLHMLGEAMRVLGGNRDLRMQLGTAGRDRALSEFTWERILARYEELWKQQLHEAAMSVAMAPADVLYPAVYDYSAVFEHYPSEPITVIDRVSLNSNCFRLLELMRRDRLFLRPDPTFDRGLDEEIIKYCQLGRAVTIKDLIIQFRRSDRPEVLIASQICRLIKYGLLRLHREVIAR